MRSMAEREADSQGTLDPPVTQALPGIPVSQVRAESRGPHLSQGNADSQDQHLDEWARQGLRGLEFPIAVRDLQHGGLSIAPLMGIAPHIGIGNTTADVDHGLPARSAMAIRAGLATLTPM